MRWTKALAGIAIVMMGGASAARASIEISSAPTNNMTCSAGVCVPTSKKAVLNATDLANMLATSDVKVATGNGAVTITVAAPFSWTSASRLTLDAAQNVTFLAEATVAGPGAVTITTNDGGSGGQLVFFEAGKLDFWDLTSSLVINGSSYTLLDDLATLASDVASTPAGTFALAKDYDATPDGKYKGAAVKTPLDGTFDGLGHTISHLRIGEHPCDGLGNGMFSLIDQSGTVRDLHLDHVHVSSGRPEADGGVAGESLGAIANVWVSGSISTGSGHAGHCSGGSAGGVVGGTGDSATIVNAHSSASIKVTFINKYGLSYAGGIAGTAFSVDLSSATGKVNGTNSTYVGGLVGAGANISRSFATGSVGGGGLTSETHSGGLLGQGGPVSNSYATGGVGGEGCSGGLIGNGEDNTTSSYSTGPASGAASGGFFGCVLFGSNANDYWDTDTSRTTTGCGSGDCTGVTGLTDTQLKSALPAGFDKTIWTRDASINNGYPYLIDNLPQ